VKSPSVLFAFLLPLTFWCLLLSGNYYTADATQTVWACLMKRELSLHIEGLYECLHTNLSELLGAFFESFRCLLCLFRAFALLQHNHETIESRNFR